VIHAKQHEYLKQATYFVQTYSVYKVLKRKPSYNIVDVVLSAGITKRWYVKKIFVLMWYHDMRPFPRTHDLPDKMCYVLQNSRAHFLQIVNVTRSVDVMFSFSIQIFATKCHKFGNSNFSAKRDSQLTKILHYLQKNCYFWLSGFVRFYLLRLWFDEILSFQSP